MTSPRVWWVLETQHFGYSGIRVTHAWLTVGTLHSIGRASVACCSPLGRRWVPNDSKESECNLKWFPMPTHQRHQGWIQYWMYSHVIYRYRQHYSYIHTPHVLTSKLHTYQVTVPAYEELQMQALSLILHTVVSGHVCAHVLIHWLVV